MSEIHFKSIQATGRDTSDTRNGAEVVGLAEKPEAGVGMKWIHL